MKKDILDKLEVALLIATQSALMIIAVAMIAMGSGGCVGTSVDIEKFGSDFDDLCIAGKLKPTSAAWLNANLDLWKQHEDYTEIRHPRPLKDGDRVFNGDCSLVTKLLIKGDVRGSLEALERVKSVD
tara:strand:+ start:41 stop:421 length:381 start_codon:yes stop_codon:yes gene_type:complete